MCNSVYKFERKNAEACPQNMPTEKEAMLILGCTFASGERLDDNRMDFWANSIHQLKPFDIREPRTSEP